MSGISPLQLLLDTVAVIAILEDDPLFHSSFSLHLQLLNHQVGIPIIVIGELYVGAENSSRITANRQRVIDLANRTSILYVDLATASTYAKITHQLKIKGKPIPQNDVWIAALALQHGLPLLTRDKHFNNIDGLTIQSW